MQTNDPKTLERFDLVIRILRHLTGRPDVFLVVEPYERVVGGLCGEPHKREMAFRAIPLAHLCVMQCIGTTEAEAIEYMIAQLRWYLDAIGPKHAGLFGEASEPLLPHDHFCGAHFKDCYGMDGFEIESDAIFDEATRKLRADYRIARAIHRAQCPLWTQGTESVAR